MREAIGSSMLLYIVVIFVSLIMLFFVGTLAYSKAYKVKNRIVEVIEKYEDYSDKALTEIEADLKNIGYQSGVNNKKCSNGNLNKSSYKYCIYKVSASNGYYYKVETFVHFDIPFIGDFIEFRVKGETKILGKSYNYE